MFIDAAPAPPAGHQTAIAFWGLRRGLFARGGTVSLTTNGGRTFRVVLRTRRVTGMQTFGRGGAILDLDNGHAFRSLDGGRTWARFRHRFDADFATANVGLGSRANGLVLTRDGGRSWERRKAPCGRRVSDSIAVELVTPTLGWIVCAGQPGAGQQLKAVYRTSDAGLTWRRRSDALSGYGYVYGASFARDGFGLVWEGRGTLYVTRDGGRRWAAKAKVAEPELDFGAGAVAFEGGAGLFLVQRNPRLRLLATHDFGRSWQLVHRWP